MSTGQTINGRAGEVAFETRDFYLACFLRCTGYDLIDLRAEGPSAFCMEPPGYMLHRWQDRQLVSHAAVLGDWPGPFPFFDAGGKLID